MTRKMKDLREENRCSHGLKERERERENEMKRKMKNVHLTQDNGEPL